MLVLRHRQKVEAKLNEQGITRYDLGRESFRTSMGLERRVCVIYSVSNGLN